jgi:hypothetical protein
LFGDARILLQIRFDMNGYSGNERRKGERRASAGQSVDVMRIEHENLCRQMEEALRVLRNIETELASHGARLRALERALEGDGRRVS